MRSSSIQSVRSQEQRLLITVHYVRRRSPERAAWRSQRAGRNATENVIAADQRRLRSCEAAVARSMVWNIWKWTIAVAGDPMRQRTVRQIPAYPSRSAGYGLGGGSGSKR